MLGSLLKIGTLPLDIANVGLDILSGGDGSKESREDIPLLGNAEELRDELAEWLDEELL